MRPGVPGTLNALLSGDAGVGGISTPAYEACFEGILSET